MGRGSRGYDPKRLASIVATRAGLLLLGLMGCGVYVAFNGIPNQNALPQVRQVPSYETLEEQQSPQGIRRRLMGKIYDGRDGKFRDDDYYQTGNNTGLFATCKSEDQPEVCRGFGADSCKKMEPSQMWGLIFVVFGLFYLFIGIAILCDELFVPALEVIAEDMKLSNDVAGATLMAAGGSAPELATSFVGTFQRSDVGFGTIVGSAVFNVLFVIGMCVMFTPPEFAPLKLTWWPLARDCSYYVLTLITLVLFMLDGKIEIWEALIQFLLYLGYVFVMSRSEALENWFKVRFQMHQVAPAPDAKGDGGTGSSDDAAGEALEKGLKPSQAHEEEEKDYGKLDANASFMRPSTFRAGILQLLTAKRPLADTAGTACVARIKGDVNEVFDELDKNKNGLIDSHELKEMLEKLGTPAAEITDEHIADMIKEIDTAGDGVIRKNEFVVWYTASEDRIKAETKKIFHEFDHNENGAIDKDEVKSLLTSLGNHVNDDEVNKALREMKVPPEGPQEVSFENFKHWYEDSLFWTERKHAADMAADSVKSMWEGTKEGFADLKDPTVPLRAKVAFVLCLPLSLFFCLIPDCRPPGQEKYAVYTFFGSIFVVGLLAINMVELATIFGDTLGIPTVVMGLTILAAGTSVPDLLSSVIVAKQGEGDMAVSSSIGSNIFDVAFGLPIPWLVFSVVTAASNCNCGVIVLTDGLVTSLVILLLMVAAIVATIHHFDWAMTPLLGKVMFIMYFAYVAQALALTPSSDWSPTTCSTPFEFNPFGV